MKRKHKPARPHWEQVVSKRANGVEIIREPESDFYLREKKRRRKTK